MYVPQFFLQSTHQPEYKYCMQCFVVHVRMIHLFVPPPRVPVTVFFTAQNEREYNFNVQCSVKRKLTPITLNVKAEVYAINVSMECEAVDGSMVKLSQGKSTVRRVDMGTVSEGILTVLPDVSLMCVVQMSS